MSPSPWFGDEHQARTCQIRRARYLDEIGATFLVLTSAPNYQHGVDLDWISYRARFGY